MPTRRARPAGRSGAPCARVAAAAGRGDRARRSAASTPALSLSRSSTSRRPARSAMTTPSTCPALVAPTATSARSGSVCCSCCASTLEAAACSGGSRAAQGSAARGAGPGRRSGRCCPASAGWWSAAVWRQPGQQFAIHSVQDQVHRRSLRMQRLGSGVGHGRGIAGIMESA